MYPFRGSPTWGHPSIWDTLQKTTYILPPTPLQGTTNRGHPTRDIFMASYNLPRQGTPLHGTPYRGQLTGNQIQVTTYR